MADNSKGKQSKFEMTIGAVDRFSNVFKGFNDRIDGAAAHMLRMQGAVNNLNRASGLNRLTGAVSGVAGSMKNVAGEGQKLLSTVSGLAGKFSLIFGAAGGGLFALARSTANAGDAAANAAARAGVGVKTWQEYAHAASLVGVGNEQMEKTLRELQDTAIKAFRGDKTQASLLRLAGINPRTAKGEVKNADSLFQELADKVKKLQEAGQGAKAVNLVKSILGDKGAQLMPLLQSGSAGLKEMRLEAHKLGLVFSEEDTRAAADFNSGLTRLLAVFRGIGHSLGRVLLPPLTKLMDKFTEWTARQREIISGGFAEWVEKLDIDRIWNSVQSGISALGRLGESVNNVAKFFGGWENVLLGLGVIIGGKFLLAIGNAIGAFAKLGLVILTTPLGWFLGAIAAIAGAVYLIYKNWDGLASYFSGLLQEVENAFSRNWLGGIVRAILNFTPLRWVSDGMNELLSYFLGFDLYAAGDRMIASFGKGIFAKWDSIAATFKEKLGALTEWLPDWAKEKMGFSLGVDASSAAPAMAAPLNLGPAARSLAESRSEHVERQENTVTLVPPEGWDMRVSGSSSGLRKNGLSMQIGHEAWGYY